MLGGGKKPVNEAIDQIIRAAKTDAGAPFEEVNMRLLAELKISRPAEFQRARAAFKKAKVNMKAFDEEVDRHRPKLRVVQPDENNEENTRERHALRAERLIESGDVLKLFLPEFGKMVAGEEKNGKLLYLIATSRLFRKPMHCVIKGMSSGGKSEIRDAVLKFMPEDQVINYTAVSQKAILRDERPYTNRILSFGEAAGVEDQSFQDYLIRELISSGRLTYAATEKNEATGRLETVPIVKEGPVSFMITTTRASLHPENETRMLSLEIDDSRDQTARVLEFVGMTEGEGYVPDVDLPEWHAFQNWLCSGPKEVVVPWGRTMTRMIPPHATRLRRDAGQILRAIKAHALLNQHHRKTEHGSIVATIEEDYRAVYGLLADYVAEGAGIKIKETVIATVLKVGALQDDADEKSGVTAVAVAKELNIDDALAGRRLREARLAGFVVNLEGRPRQPGKWRCTDKPVESAPLLPAWEDLHERWNSRPI